MSTPSNVEDALAAHAQVVESAVIGQLHPQWGEMVVAYVLPAQDAALTPEQLTAFLGEGLANYKIPREIKLVATLPHTPTGKVMKFKLREEQAYTCSTFF